MEIKFRGKHIHAGECNKHLDGTWVHGYLADKNYINSEEYGEMMVDHNTIGWTCGSKDIDGTEIYTGDIIKTKEGVVGIIKFGDYNPNHTMHKGFYIEFQKQKYYRKDLNFWIKNKITVVGNIYDNPELLER